MNEQNKENIKNEIIRVMPIRLRLMLSNIISADAESINEIVLRTGRLLCIYKKGIQFFLTENGCLTQSVKIQNPVICTEKDIADTFNSACCFSVYSHINEIKEGFITISGGHRVGISGTAVVNNGQIINIRDVSTVSVRIAREVIGCGEDVVCELLRSRKGLLICGSPCSGKTTVLRDVARLLSTQYGYRVSLIDSRGELAAVHKGINQMNTGLCDVLDGYPRAQGIEQAVRILSPDFVICDEIGSDEDVNAIVSGLNSGAVFIATMHAGSKAELLQRKNAEKILGSGAFGKVMFLSGRENPGKITINIDSEDLIDV